MRAILTILILLISSQSYAMPPAMFGNSSTACGVTETTETSCSDTYDNDCDGDIDEADSDCTAPTLLLEEPWGATTSMTWSTLPTGWDHNYTTATIDGAVLKLVSEGTPYYTSDFTASDNFYLVGKVQKESAATGSGDCFHVTLRNSSGTDVVGAYFWTNSSTDQFYRIYSYYSGAQGSYVGTTISCTSDVLVFKIEYNKGTGANGVYNLYVTTYSDYSVNGWTAAGSLEVSTTTDTDQIAQVAITDNGSIATGILIDTLQGDDTDDVDW